VAKNSKYKYYTLLSICVILYLSAVISYAVWSNQERKKLIITEIDDKLLTAAKGIKYMLAADFHDRALNEKSISFDEEMKNRKALNSFVKETEFTWMYTLVEKDGNFYFSAPTVTDQEAKELISWYFYPYKDIPEDFIKAFREKKPYFVSYTDQWGSYRSVAIPEVSSEGRSYLSCADYDITYLNAILKDNLIKSILSALYFVLFSFPFIFVFRRFFSSYTVTLKEMNDELIVHKDHLETLIDERTSELTTAYDRLQEELHERAIIEENLIEERNRLMEALAEVKTLSGLLPICSSCKKIRDDGGYWNQIEKYVQEHSGATFSHGICPDYAKKLYPEFSD
jgi:hypothetical protein